MANVYLSGSVRTYTVGGSTGAASPALGYADRFTATISCASTGTVKLDLQVALGSSNTWTVLNTWNINIASTGSQYSTTHPVEAHIPVSFAPYDYNQNIKWKLRATDPSGSKMSYFPTNSQYYLIASPPALTSCTIYNQHSDGNVTGSVGATSTRTGHIWKYGRIKFPDDGSVSNWRVDGINVDVIDQSSDVSENSAYVDFTIPETIDPGTEVQFKVGGWTDGSYRKKEFTFSMLTAPNPFSIDSFVFPQVIKPFTANSVETVKFGWPAASPSNYDIEITTSGNSVYIKPSITNLQVVKDLNINNKYIAEPASSTTGWLWTGDYIERSFNLAKFYPFNNALGIYTYSGQVTFQARLEIQNVFGRKFYTKWLFSKFDFDEPLQAASIGSPAWASSSTATTWYSVGANSAVWEGMYLKFPITVKQYQTGNINLSGTLFGQSFFEETVSITAAATATATSTIFNVIAGPLPSLASNVGSVSLIATNNYSSLASSYSLKLGRLTDANYVLTSVSASKNGSNYNVSYSYSGNDAGTNTTIGGYTIRKYLKYGNEQVEITNYSTSSTVAVPTSTWGAKSVQLLTDVSVSSTIGGAAYTNSHQTYSNVIVAYSESPTISYRANQIGINTPDVGSNTAYESSIIVASKYDNKNLIKLVGGTPSNPLIITINLDQKRIY